MPDPATQAKAAPRVGSAPEVFRVFLRLGLTSFGGPVAHIGYFRDEIVVRRRWLDEAAYADLVALCQVLPGPASSQVGLGIGLMRAGLPGALAAWTGFTLPSAIILVAFAYGLLAVGGEPGGGWLAGLKAAAVAVVAQAVWGMGRALAPDPLRRSLAVVCCLMVLALSGVAGQLGALLFGALVGLVACRERGERIAEAPALPGGRRRALTCIGVFFALLAALPLLAALLPGRGIELVDAFYRAGALIFGGGHVVLPLLQAEVVAPGWIGSDSFLAGYGAAQAVPGPLLTFSAYLGAMMDAPPNGWQGAVICLLAIFLPSFLLVPGALPLWQGLRQAPLARAALRGVNAAVVGLLLAALYDPVWTAGITGPGAFAVALAALLLLAVWKLPPWLVVVLSALAGALVI